MVIGGKRRVVEASETSDIEHNDKNEQHLETEESEEPLEPWKQFLERSARMVEEKLAASGQEEWLVTWSRRKWRFAGKMARLEQHKWSFAALTWNPNGYRAQARAHKRWDDDFNELLKSMEICESWMSLAKDSKKWQALEQNFVRKVVE